MKKLFFFLLLSVVYSCNNNIEPLDPKLLELQPEPNEIKITIEGLESIDYTPVTAITLDESTDISTQGIFENPYVDNGIEDLPVLLVENDNVLLGYFPHTLQSNKVDIDDILLFYFLTYPELAIQGFDYSEIKDKIKSSSDYAKMKELVVSDLNLNKSPLDNDAFNDIVRSTTVEIKQANSRRGSGTKTGGIDTFQFTYDRDGKISWLDEVPLFAAVGISIKNETSGEVILKPNILKNKNLVLSPGSVLSWMFKELFTDLNEDKIESLNMIKAGEHSISFSNGSSSDSALNSLAKKRNRRYMGSNILGLIVPLSLKALSTNVNCASTIDDVITEVYVEVDKIVLESKVPDTGDLIEQIYKLSEKSADIIVACLGPETSPGIYLRVLTSTISKRLAVAEDISELMFLIRDYIGSNISGTEKRYFSNGISFGELKGKDESEIEFQDDPESIHTYTKTFEESVITYDVDRGILTSSFQLQKDWKPAVNLPFIPEVISGNADVSDNPFDAEGQINTSLKGTISIKMKMGEDNSEVEIKPDFESDFVKNQTITLTPNNIIKLSGNMDFGEVKVDETKGELLTIENKTDKVLNVTSISVPDGFSHTWESAPIAPKGSKSFIVVFEPTDPKEYKGTITVVNDLDNVNNTIPVSGIGTDDKITLEGNLDFGTVEINPDVPPTKSFYISNYNLSKTINVDPIINLPEGFTATGWVTGGALGPGAKKEVVITFNPIVAKDYGIGSVIEVVNDVDQINNKIPVSGVGYDSSIKIEGTWYGETEVSKCTPARSDTVTPNCEMHVVLNERDVVFIGDTTLPCDSGSECGLVIFNFYTGTERVLKNKYEFDGTTLTIQMITTSSGRYFSGRTYNYTGVINATGDKIEGNYTMDMPGGIWGAYTEGTMTFTKK